MNNTSSSQDRAIEAAQRTAASVDDDVTALVDIISELDAACDELKKEIEKLNDEIAELKNIRTE